MNTNRVSARAIVAVSCIAVLAAAAGFWGGVSAQGILTAKEVYRKALTDAPGKEIRIIDLSIPPGGTSPAHRHPGDTFVYVIEGAVQIGVDDNAPITAKAGEVVHEPPMSLHKTTLNPSKTDKTHAIAIMIIDADQQSTVAPGHAAH